ncbi:MAG: DNA-3-methyladenine glycosylase 2 family protein [Gammaproteobacteria bacterium]|nr:DNA-3-methyladenine glycosylase 2 family protein [Gammaproteobacteria bacterium]
MDQSKIKRHLNALANIDADVRRGLQLVLYPPPRIRAQGFEAFLSTIVSQQISTEAAAAIMRRLRALLPGMDAAEVLELPTGALRDAGLSARKVEYVEGLAKAMTSGQFDPAGLSEMDDRAAIEAITSLRGFGAWSAEIYLMFSLQRSDVFPAGDLALRIALQKLKGIEQALDEKQARAVVESWAPYRSAGSLFLWHYYRGAPT